RPLNTPAMPARSSSAGGSDILTSGIVSLPHVHKRRIAEDSEITSALKRRSGAAMIGARLDRGDGHEVRTVVRPAQPRGQWAPHAGPVPADARADRAGRGARLRRHLALRAPLHGRRLP